MVTACTPALNWREVLLNDDHALAMFPCKPNTHQRHIRLATAEVQWQLLECTTDGLTWAVGYADLAEPARVTPALVALRHATALNIGATSQRDLALPVQGETPNDASAAALLEGGRLPNGSPVLAQVAVFAKGTTVFQAMVLGERLPGEAVQTFFTGLRLLP